MEVIRISLFLKQKLMVMMIDVSMACTVSKFYTDTPEQEAVSVSEWCGVWFCWSYPRFRYFRRCSAALGHPPGCDPPDRGGGWVWKSKRKPGGGGAAARRTHHCCQRIQCSPTRTSDPDRGSFWGRGWLQEGTVSRAQASDQDKVLMSTDSFVMSRWHMLSSFFFSAEFGGEQRVQGDVCDLPDVRTCLLSSVWRWQQHRHETPNAQSARHTTALPSTLQLWP